MTRALGLVVITACWTSSAPPPVEPQPPPPVAARRVASSARTPCETTVDHLVEIERDELAKVPDFADKLDTIREVAIASCLETQWSAEVIRCFSDTDDTSALSQCESLFTSAQTQDLLRRVTEILTGLNAPPPITPTP
ncbi:MAG: hypothetical protein ABI678_03410 [Kofleriaceae bacterium]